MAEVVDLSVPKSWSELSQGQLRFLLRAMADVQRSLLNVGFRSVEDYAAQSSAHVAALCFVKWARLRVVCAYGDGWLLSLGKKEFAVSSQTLAAALSHLDWIKELPKEPVRLDAVDGAKAVPADISSEFSFDSWLSCEALWQAYQIANDDEMLRRMAEVLYRKAGIKLDQAEALGVFYWWAAVKAMVSEMFPYFFKPSGSDSGFQPSTDAFRRNMDAQIRALTKGDITKEKEILAMDALRALTELDAQAREYDELNRKYPTK